MFLQIITFVFELLYSKYHNKTFPSFDVRKMNLALKKQAIKQSEIYLSLNESDFSIDHKIKDNCVMPFMTAVCKILKFVSCVYDERNTIAKVTNIRLFKGIIWREKLIELQLKIIETTTNGNKLKCTLKQKNEKATKPQFLWLPLYSLEVELAPRKDDSRIFTNDINNVISSSKQMVPPSSYSAIWDFIATPLICNIYDCPALFHGPSFQLLRKVGDITDNSIKGIAEFNTSNVQIDKFYDGAMQLILKFVWDKYRKMCLPHSGNDVVLFESLYNMKKYKVIGLELINITNINENNRISFDYILYNDQMKVVSSGKGCVIAV